jgi:hypothetical protein
MAVIGAVFREITGAKAVLCGGEVFPRNVFGYIQYQPAGIVEP